MKGVNLVVERPAPRAQADHEAAVHWPAWAMPLALAALLLLVFGPALLSPTRVASGPMTDAELYFAPARAFGFGELRHGRIALWNPHQFSGTPFAGNFQSALFYPLNVIYLALPLALALNLEMVLHLFLLGWGMTLWVGRRGLHPAATLLAATLTMFGAPVFMRTYAGHLTLIDAVAWMPFVLLAIDLLWEGRMAAAALLGTGAFAMQMLAGHPQTVYLTILTAALYALLRLPDDRGRWKQFLWLPVCCVGAAALAAVQLGASADAALDSTRQGALSPEFAAGFSLTPLSLITALAPGAFGDMHHFAYWGAWNVWEEAVFIGVLGLALAVYGASCAAHPFRRRAAALAVLGVLLALAPNTPLFPLLYHGLPGYNRFRADDRFLIPAVLFAALLAGMGTDTLLRAPRRLKAAAACGLAAALLLALLAGAIRAASAGAGLPWQHFVQATADGKLAAMPRAELADFSARAASFARSQCLSGAVLLLVFALLVLATKRYRAAPWALWALALMEIVVFAYRSEGAFDIRAAAPVSEEQFLSGHPGDGRIWQAAGGPNDATALGASDVWGYDPVELRRYAEFMAWTQGEGPAQAADGVIFHGVSPLFRLLRLRYVFTAGPDGTPQVTTVPGALPHLLLVPGWQSAPTQAARFAALGAPSFDPTRTVLLESPPHPAPAPGAPAGTVTLTASDCNSLTIAADTPRPAILLITDAYARGWRAVALPGSVQQHYDLLPADDVLRAVPLAAGHHRLRVEYAPTGFRVGTVVSLVALAAYLAACGWALAIRVRRSWAARELLAPMSGDSA